MLRRSSVLALLCVLAFGATSARAVVPETEVAGAGTKWFSGSLIQQPGQNCSVLGSPYSEIMVSGVGSYGGTQGVVKVGDAYWTALLVAIPGNPCGPGSSGVATDLVLPPNTAIDPTRPIRCFGQPRNSNDFVELTGGRWSAFNSSGDYCPAQASPSAFHQGAWSIGFRPLASGQLFQVFVPVKSTAALVGAGTSPPDAFRWLTDATGVYANPGLSEVWANVLSQSAGATPFVYFAREPSAQPFWKADAPASPDTRNRAEFWANLYVAGQAGTVTFEIRRTDDNSIVATDATPGSGWNGAVPSGQDLLQVVATGAAAGPNGGYAPFAFDPPGTPGNVRGEWDVPMTIKWTFTPTVGSPVSNTTSFRTLAGPDADGDGVADVKDACPAVKGTTADGCLPQAPPDPDGDGVFGADDRCPDQPAPGVIGGCPPPGPGGPQAPGGGTAPPQLVATLGTRRNTRFKAAALRRGAKVKVRCSKDATAAVALTVPAAAARRLGLKARRGIATVASGKAACRAATGATVRLKVAQARARRIGRLRRPVAARLVVTLTAPGATAGKASVRVRLG